MYLCSIFSRNCMSNQFPNFTCLTPDDITPQLGSSAASCVKKMKHSWWYLILVIHAFLEENILHSGCLPDTKPQYLHAICLNYFPHSFNMHAKMIQNTFQLNSRKCSGSVSKTITFLAAYICLSPGFKWVEFQEHSTRLCANRWPYRLGWGPVG